jgi:hypothetical protein
VFHEAFKRLAKDPEVRPGMELLSTLFWLGKERDTIEALETELSRLQHIINANATSSWWPAASGSEYDVLIVRQQFLLRELAISQDKCAKWEARKSNALAAKAAFEAKK